MKKIILITTLIGFNFLGNSQRRPTVGVSIIPFTGTVTMNLMSLNSSPVDAQTVYFGYLPKAPVTVAGTSKVYFRDSCYIEAAEIYSYATTAGSAEGWSVYIRKNNTTDFLISTVSAATNERVFTNQNLIVRMRPGDYIEIKLINPTWATNPNNVVFGGYIIIK